MTKNFSFLIGTVALVLLLAACNKSIEDPIPLPPPNNTDTTSYAQFSVSGIQLGGDHYHVLLSIESKTGKAEITNKKVTLDNILGTYKTDKIKISKGEFKLVKFIVVNNSDTAVYASPKANTSKATQVENPLAIGFAVTNRGINSSAVQVLKIVESESPLNYGYTTDDFGYLPHVNIRVKLKINVGEVAYDSLPGKLNVEAINAEGAAWSREIDMARGITNVRVPANYVSFKFKANKWNTIAQQHFNSGEIQSNMIVALESFRQPKKLREESVFVENVAGFIPDSRTEYFYNGQGLLQEIKNYQKSLQVSSLRLTNIYKFKYSGTQLDSINRFAANNLSTGYTAFFYSGGRISNMSNRSYDQQTGVAVEYLASGDNEMINGDYFFDNGNTMNYKIFLSDGNKISDQAQSSTGGSESGIYEYDDNINPHHQIGYPDLFFSNYSKNNRVKEQKNYSNFPSVVPYKFEYSYDADGYPAAVFISYKGFTSQQHLYRLKKIYSYQ